jgi:hypothetical protein
MTTKLDKPLRRELEINGKPFVLTISPDGLKLVPKGKRKGHELAWAALVSGEAALAVALNASLDRSVPAQSKNTATSGLGRARASRKGGNLA